MVNFLFILLYLFIVGGVYYFLTEVLDWDTSYPGPYFCAGLFPVVLPLILSYNLFRFAHKKFQNYNYKRQR